MEPNNLEGRSRGSSFRRRALTLVGASALTLSGLGAAVFGASQAFAATAITAQPFNIGTTVSSVTFATNNTTTSAGSVTYTIGFTVTTALPSGDTITITSPAATKGTSGVLTDSTTASGTQGVTLAGGSTITTTAALKAGDSVSLVITGNTNPSTAGNISAKVATQTDPGVVSSNTVTLTSTAAVTGSLSSQTPGASGVTMQVSNVSANALTSGVDYVMISDASPYAAAPSETVTFPTSASSYTVTDTTTGASASATGAVTTAAETGTNSISHYAYFLSPISASAGDKLVVSVAGVINDGSAQAQTLQVLTLGASVAPTMTAANGSSTTPAFIPTTASGTSSFWSLNGSSGDAGGDVTSAATTTGSAVTGVSVSLSNSVASQTNVTYTLTFTATSAVASASDTLFVSGIGQAPSGTNILTDTTANSTTSVTFAQVGATTTYENSTALAFTKGDSYTLTSYGVQNSATSGSQKATVYTSVDNIPVSASYTLSSASTLGPFVSLSSTTTGASTTWTFTGFKANAALTGGTDSIIIAGATGSTFPGAASDYTITDLTNSSGSGTAKSVSGAGSGGATLLLSNDISANDNLELVVAGVINSSTGGSFAAVTLDTSPTAGELSGAAQVSTPAPTTTAPDAATTGSNGALVNVNGTIYVYAGGVAFGIPTPAVFNTISTELGNPTVVTASSVTTTGTVRNGTLVQVAGSPEIGVVSSGTYYGFSTASQFLSDGYSFGDVIDVPNLGSLATGTGAPANAAATASDGALVNVSGTIYVYAGGVAVGIPTPAVFSTISAAEGNPTVVTASSVTTTGTMATGTLVQVVGSPQVNVVTSTGTQVGFMTASGFTGDGYSWGRIIMIP